MKPLYLLTACLLLLSCGSRRHITRSEKTAIHDTVYRFKDRFIETRVHDTIITTPGSTVGQYFFNWQLQPSTSGGQKEPKTYTNKAGHTTLTTTVDTAGNVHINCTADSLKLVIAALQETIIRQSDSLAHTTSHTTATSEVVKIVKPPFYLTWWFWAIIVVVVAAIFEVKARIKTNT